jgi:hypothetical protein
MSVSASIKPLLGQKVVSPERHEFFTLGYSLFFHPSLEHRPPPNLLAIENNILCVKIIIFTNHNHRP